VRPASFARGMRIDSNVVPTDPDFNGVHNRVLTPGGAATCCQHTAEVEELEARVRSGMTPTNVTTLAALHPAKQGAMDAAKLSRVESDVILVGVVEVVSQGKKARSWQVVVSGVYDHGGQHSTTSTVR
jgi:hypothetical protein